METDMYSTPNKKRKYSLVFRSSDLNFKVRASCLEPGPIKTMDFIHIFAVCDGELLACPCCRYPAIFVKKKNKGPYIHLNHPKTQTTNIEAFYQVSRGPQACRSRASSSKNLPNSMFLILINF